MSFFKSASAGEFREALNETVVEMYINRFDDEITELNKTHKARKNRVKPTRLIQLELVKEKNINDYKSGGIGNK